RVLKAWLFGCPSGYSESYQPSREVYSGSLLVMRHSCQSGAAISCETFASKVSVYPVTSRGRHDIITVMEKRESSHQRRRTRGVEAWGGDLAVIACPHCQSIRHRPQFDDLPDF